MSATLETIPPFAPADRFEAGLLEAWTLGREGECPIDCARILYDLAQDEFPQCVPALGHVARMFRRIDAAVKRHRPNSLTATGSLLCDVQMGAAGGDLTLFVLDRVAVSPSQQGIPSSYLTIGDKVFRTTTRRPPVTTWTSPDLSHLPDLVRLALFDLAGFMAGLPLPGIHDYMHVYPMLGPDGLPRPIRTPNP